LGAALGHGVRDRAAAQPASVLRVAEHNRAADRQFLKMLPSISV
jgi:hypothetical protein